MTKRPAGQIITFYSYKGGTGRTMALANLACLLARPDPGHRQPHTPRVLAIDWDFEAPGLHRYLQPYLEPDAERRFRNAPGCLELFEHLGSLRTDYDREEFVGNRHRARTTLESLDLEPYLLATQIPGLSLMKAGLFNDDYPRRASGFDWDELFHATVGLFAGVADFLRARFEYVLVDSRTGITDTSGICTMLLPDKLVVVFTPNQQSLTGIESLVRKAVAYRKGSPDGRPLTVFPLPSRVETARPQLLEAWRNGSGTDTAAATLLPPDMLGYQPTFEQLFADIYALPRVQLGEYFDEILLQHVPDYAYGEPVAVVLETVDTRVSLSRSYAAFRDRLVELDVPWSSLSVARLERDIVKRCEVIEEQLKLGSVEEAIQLGVALIEHNPPESQFERSTSVILEVARAAYPRNRAAASTLLRQCFRRALAEGDIGAPLLAQVLLDAGTLSQEFGDPQLARELLEKSRKNFTASLGAEHPATLTAEDKYATALKALGEFHRARLLHQEVLQVRQRVLGEEHPDTLTSMTNLAQMLRAQGDLAEARTLEEKVLAIRRRVLGDDHPDTLTSVSNLAQTLRAQGDLTQAGTLQERVRDARRRVLGEEHPDTLASMSNLASTLRAQGDLGAARLFQEQALALYRRVLGEEHPDTLVSMNNLANTLYAQGDFGAARALQEQVLSARRRVLGEEHPNTLASMSNLANTLYAQGNLTAARELQERALSARRRVLGEEHPNTLISMSNLANTLHAQAEFAAARALQDQVLSARRRVLGEEHPDTLSSLNNLAYTLFSQGKFAAARELQEQALSIRRRVLGEEHPDTLNSMNNLADTLRAEGNLRAARELQEPALLIRRRVLGEEHPDTLISMSDLAETLRAQGDLAGARALIERLLSTSGTALGEENPTTLSAQAKLAIAARDQGSLEEAREIGERVLHLRTRILGATHPSTLDSMRDLGETLKRLGNTEKALDLLSRAFDLQAKGQTRSER
jgi:eukaryotic-like serine/threonine-protein kinase